MAALLFLAAFSAIAQPSNGVYREVYLNIGGSSIPDLTNNPAFPDAPSIDEVIGGPFEAPVNWADNYGQRIRALVTAPTTGNYTFWISSDDGSELWLSTDATPANRRRIASVSSWTGSREWTKEANQASGPVALLAGQSYYLEALMKEGTGGDNLAVRWQLPGNVWENPADTNAPIPAARLRPYGLTLPAFAQQPANVTLVEGSSTVFTVRLMRYIGAGFQWQRNATNVPGGTTNTLAVGPVTLADSGAVFRCVVTNLVGATNTTNAVLTVVRDTTRPVISAVSSLGDPTLISVVFSEDVEAATATNVANYSMSLGVAVTGATFGPDNRTILLTTTPLAQNVTYVLTVNNVRDRASIPNTIASDSIRAFAISATPLAASYWKPGSEPPGPSSRRGGLVISEIMYHPTNRLDGRNVEFVEVYNTLPWYEDLSGYQITGAIEYTFPSNYVLGARSFAVIAKSPADMQAVYGTPGVLGPWTGALQNGSGTLRLKNRLGAILFEMTYSGDAPWPAAADGAGHSLVMARPSFGESDPRAWAASDTVGGTPGTNEVATSNPLAALMINEFFAHSDPPLVDYIELFNYSAASLNVGGCTLSDDPDTNKFVIPANTIIGPSSFLVFYETNLGFALSSAGESIYLRNPQRTRVLDCARFGPQQAGVSTGRYPDGAPAFSRLQAMTPGTNNAPVLPSAVVINEIMYHPISDNPDDSFIELYNSGTNRIDLSDWRIEGGVSFTLPQNTGIPADGYLVIAQNALRLRAQYGGLTAANCLGNWKGSLKQRGERVALSRPEMVITTNGSGIVTTNVHHIVVDEVTYHNGGRWGQWSDAGGSSLELRDWRADRRLEANWADSDETTRSGWMNVEATGVMANGYADANQLHITLLGDGECLVDNVEVIPGGGANALANSSFESGTTGWTFQGNHNGSSLETAGGYFSGRSLHLRATGRGDTGANRVRAQLSSTLAPGTTVTLRAKVRWLKGNPHILLRLRGNWHEAAGTIVSGAAFGTPGARNSAAVPNAPPAITGVSHWPALPAGGQAVLVTARVSDADGLATLSLKYRLDPATTFSSVPMLNNGGGLFSGTIPAQPTNVLAAFYIAASDKMGASSTFPNDSPLRECVVRWGDTVIYGSLPSYRFWITTNNIQRWISEEKMSNRPKDVTFVYGTNRVIYNAGAWFHGSPYHSPGYDSPLGSGCDYDMAFPTDDRLLGETDINLFRPGNGGGDGTAQAEIHGHWWASQFGIPFLFHRPVFVTVNGMRRETVYYDAQQPNGDFAKQWFSSDDGGELHKVQLGFEFGDQAYGASEPGYAAVGAALTRVLTPSGAFHVPRYRQTLPLRSAAVFDENNYTNLFSLINSVLTNISVASPAYTAVLTNATDVEEWFKVHVLQHLWENTDSFSWGGGQNAFIYKPERSPWKLLLWDIDFAFGGSGGNADLFSIGGADHGPRNDHAPFRRIYYQALLEAVNGFMLPTRSFPILDARYSGMVAAGAGVSSPDGIKNFINTKRAVVFAQVTNIVAPFSIISNGGTDFSTSSNLVTLTGTAPLDVKTIEVNGVTCNLTWITVTNWTATIALPAGTNVLSVVGRDRLGSIVLGATKTVTATVTAAPAQPQDWVAINEIMYAPKMPGAEYIEICNRSATASFDLSRWRVDGIDYTFPDNSILSPRRYLLLVKDAAAFAAAYGTNLGVFAEYDGNLQGGGETLTLLKPGAAAGTETIVDRVRYDNAAPWPAAAANGTGSSLQLIDPAQDHARVANWLAKYAAGISVPEQSTPAHTNDGWRFVSMTSAFGGNNRLLIYLDYAGSVVVDDIVLVSGTTPEVGYNYVQNGGFESALDTNVWVLGTNMGATSVVGDNTHSGGGALRLVQTSPGAPGVVSRDLVQSVANAPTNGQICTLSFWYSATNNTATNLTVRLVSSAFQLVTNIGVFFVPSNYVPAQVIGETNYATPGASNTFTTNLSAFPTLWINEVQAENVTGIADSAGEHEPWVELYNSGSNTVALDGLFLANNYTNLAQWAFRPGVTIAPRQFRLVFLDGQESQSTSSEIHGGFRLVAGAGAIALSRIANGATQVLDYVNYNIGVDHSFGSYPDGQPFARQEFYFETPGATNNGTLPPINVSINEWMADNIGTLADPADNSFEDWFELYNPATNAVSLAGYFLTDILTNKFKYQIPNGYSIPAHGYLLVWADGDTGQNSASRPDLHVSFSLSKSGEAIGLFTPDGLQVDAVVFGAQTSDVSMGRFPDGRGAIYSLTNATPRAANFYPLPNSRPVLAPIANQTVFEGALFGYAPSVTDTDSPPQQMSWALEGPAGATIDPQNGSVLWQTGEAVGGGTYPFSVRVSDSGVPSLGATQTFTLTVLKTNSAPLLTPVADMAVSAGSTLTFNTEATDADLPAQVLEFSLDAGAPAGAVIDPGLGVFRWTPSASQVGVHAITIRVRDDGTPPMSDSSTFSVTVNASIASTAAYMDGIALSNGVVRVQWQSVAGQSYRVEYSTNLTAGSWAPVGSGVVANSTTTAVTDPVASGGQRFYRVVSP